MVLHIHLSKILYQINQVKVTYSFIILIKQSCNQALIEIFRFSFRKLKSKKGYDMLLVGFIIILNNYWANFSSFDLQDGLNYF